MYRYLLLPCVEGLGRMFYVASPSETSYPDLASIPFSFVARAPPYFFGLIFLEWGLKWLQGDRPRLNDGVLSVVHGLIMMMME